MKIYVCWTSASKIGTHEHVCGEAQDAVVEAGYEPEVKKAYGWRVLPGFLNATSGRKAVAAGNNGDVSVPALELDDGTWIQGSREIKEWAKANPAS